MRRAHMKWLTRVMRSPVAENFRIPAQRVDEGGLERLRKTHVGRDWGKRGWDEAFISADRMTGQQDSSEE